MSEPTDDAVPFSVGEMVENVTALQDHTRRVPGEHTAEDVLQVVVTMLENTACPHTDCPRLLTEHPASTEEE